MSLSTDVHNDAVYYDPYNVDIQVDPYPTFRRMRDEAPLYYNAEYDFYAVSRHADVERGLSDYRIFSSARSDILEFIKADVEFPVGIFIFEDPPVHTIHRALLSRVFTPRAISSLEPKIRDFCARALDQVRDSDGFDFVADLGSIMAMRTIGWLLGIPEADQQAIHDRVGSSIATEPGKPMASDTIDNLAGEAFYSDYVDWRMTHPSDDLITKLMTAEFEDHTGKTRRLDRDETLNYVNLLAGAGNETTTKLVGWAGKVLADHPDARHALAADPALIPNAVEELLRFEAPGPTFARYVTEDVEFHGQTVPAGSTLLCVVGSANRDERRFADPDTFDIYRDGRAHMTFSIGTHYCMGAALARLEGRIAIEEALKRFPDWTVDEANAKLAFTSTVRGYESLPVVVR
jgi:cytochrome P450